MAEGTSESSIYVRPTGRVIGIIRRNWRNYCGVLLPTVNTEKTRHIFIPSEKRIPRIRIETRQADVLMSHRIIVSVDCWPRSSRYPLGHFIRDIGPMGDRDTEEEVLLLEHDVPHLPFRLRFFFSGCHRPTQWCWLFWVKDPLFHWMWLAGWAALAVTVHRQIF